MLVNNLESAKDKTSAEQFAKAAEHIRRNHALIKEKWVDQVRENILDSNQQTSKSLINSLDKFLEELAKYVEQGYYIYNPSEETGMSKDHGMHRASFSGYFYLSS